MASVGGIRAGAAFVEIYLRDDKMQKGLARAARSIKNLAGSVNVLSNRMLGLGAALVIPFALASRATATFEDSLATAAGILRLTQDQVASMRDEILSLAASSTFTGREVASSFAELARGGFDAEQSIAALPKVLTLARAAASDLTETTKGLIGVQNQFRLGTGDMARVIDVLATATVSSAQELQDLFEGFKLSGPIANAAGEDILSTAKAISVLANAGIVGSRAATGLARILKNLAQESTRLELAQALGDDAFSFADAQGNFRPLVDIMAELKDKTKDLGSLERVGIYDALFGRGTAAALNLTIEQIEHMDTSFGDLSGRAAELQKDMLNSFGAVYRGVGVLVERIGIELVNALEIDPQRAVAAFKDIGDQIANVLRTNKEWVKSIALGIVQMLGLAVALKVVSYALSLVAAGLIGVQVALSAALTALGLLRIGFVALKFVIVDFAIMNVAANTLSGSIKLIGLAFQGAFAVAEIAITGITTAVQFMSAAVPAAVGLMTISVRGIVVAAYAAEAAITAVLYSVVSVVQIVVTAISAAASAVHGAAVASIATVTALASSAMAAASGLSIASITATATAAMAWISGVVTGAMATVTASTTAAIASVTAAATAAVAAVTGFIASVGAVIAGLPLLTIVLGIAAITAAVLVFGGIIKAFFVGAYNAIASVITSIGQLFVDMFSGITNLVNSVVDSIASAAVSIYDTFAQLASDIAGVFVSLWDSVSASFGRAKEVFKLGDIQDTLRQVSLEFDVILASLAEGFYKLSGSIKTVMNDIYKAVREAVTKLVNEWERAKFIMFGGEFNASFEGPTPDLFGDDSKKSLQEAQQARADAEAAAKAGVADTRFKNEIDAIVGEANSSWDDMLKRQANALEAAKNKQKVTAGELAEDIDKALNIEGLRLRIEELKDTMASSVLGESAKGTFGTSAMALRQFGNAIKQSDNMEEKQLHELKKLNRSLEKELAGTFGSPAGG